MLAFNGEASHLYKDEMRKGTNFLGSLKLNTGKVLNNILFHSILDVLFPLPLSPFVEVKYE